MAGETTTSTADDLQYSSIIAPILMATLAERAAFLMFPREFSLVGQPSGTLKVPAVTSFYGSPNDRGAGVDTEFNATQASALANTAVSTSSVTIATSEFGVALAVTDNVTEDSVDSIDIINALSGQMMQALALCMASDYVSAFANLANSIGTTTVDITLAQLLAAKNDIRTRGGFAPNGIGYVLDTIQFTDLEGILTSTNAAAAVWALSADRILNWQPGENNGMIDGKAASFRGDPVYVSGLCLTANAGADVVGAAVTPSTAANDAAGLPTHGQVWKRLPRLEKNRNIQLRADEIVASLRWGVDELLDGTGSKFVTDAP